VKGARSWTWADAWSKITDRNASPAMAVAEHWLGGTVDRSAGRKLALAALASALIVMISGVLASPALASTIHVNCSSTDLQSKINTAPGGSTLLVKGTCIGNFTVNEDLTLQGDPSATLDGNDTGRTLTIPTTHTVHLISLTISGGAASVGAGIFRPGTGTRTLTLHNVTVQDNVASGTTAEGGGIFSSHGHLILTASRVEGNRASATGTASATAVGAGILSSGPLTLVGTTVSSNRAVANSSGGSSTAVGGGVEGGSGLLTVSSSHLDGNHATAIATNSATAVGGGLYWNDSTFDASVRSSTLNANVVTATTTAGSGGAIGVGGGADLTIHSGVVSDTLLAGNQVTATSFGGGGVAVGGGAGITSSTGTTVTRTRITGSHLAADGATNATAVGGGATVSGPLVVRSSSFSTNTMRAHSGTGPASAGAGGLSGDSGKRLSLSKTTVDQNHVVAESAGADASTYGGGTAGGSPLSVVASTISRNTLKATAQGAHTAAANGAGMVASGSSAKITNSTIASNLGRAVSGAASGTAVGAGGGIYSNSTSLQLLDTTVARNLASGVAHLHTIHGGGLEVASGTTTIEATILGLNSAPAVGGPNCNGTVKSSGFNVLGSTSGCTFMHKPSDKLNVNPKLGALANNGGPTLTLALLAGSPAIDRIPPVACAVHADQRGVHRPQGPRCDTGAFEVHP
jgi:fibronectin-binding autotransporter adhesin